MNEKQEKKEKRCFASSTNILWYAIKRMVTMSDKGMGISRHFHFISLGRSALKLSLLAENHSPGSHPHGDKSLELLTNGLGESVNEEAHDLELVVGVRGISNFIDFLSRGILEHGSALVGEGGEGSHTVVVTLARRTNTTERKREFLQVHKGIVNADTTRLSAVENPVGSLFTLGEDVQGQWVIAGIDDINSLLQFLINNDGQDRAKDFLSHQVGVVIGDISDNGRGNVAVSSIGFTTNSNLGSVDALNHTLETLKVAVSDNTTVRFRSLRLAAIVFFKGSADLGNKRLQQWLVDQDIVRSNTGLAIVEEFTPHKTAGGDVEISIRSNHSRRLATQFQSNRAKVLGSRGHYDLTDRAITSVEDVIESLF